MKVDLIDHMGDDLRVVNAARVSYRKEHAEFQGNDSGLLRYLAKHGHWSPYAHPQLTFRISASLAVARQLYKHVVGLVRTDDDEFDDDPLLLALLLEQITDPIPNEVSRRYVTDEPVFDLPEVWRKAPGPGQSKQGSGEPFSPASQAWFTDKMQAAMDDAAWHYEGLLNAGLAPEQARLVLSMATLTEWYWTGSLMAFIRVCMERLAPDAQAETRAVAEVIRGHLVKLFPESAKAWGLVTA